MDPHLPIFSVTVQNTRRRAKHSRRTTKAEKIRERYKPTETPKVVTPVALSKAEPTQPQWSG